MINKTELGNRIRERRKALNLTQAQLAERTGLKSSTVASIERGDNGMPNAEAFMLLAMHLKVTPEWLATGIGREGEELEFAVLGLLIQQALPDEQLNPVEVGNLMRAIHRFEAMGSPLSREMVAELFHTFQR